MPQPMLPVGDEKSVNSVTVRTGPPGGVVACGGWVGATVDVDVDVARVVVVCSGSVLELVSVLRAQPDSRSDTSAVAASTWLRILVIGRKLVGQCPVSAPPSEDEVAAALRRAGARFAFVHGSRAGGGGTPRPDSDLDVGAWWGTDPPDPWKVEVPAGVDLLVLDTAPLWLAGRVAMHGRLLFDDDPAARVRWQADTRLVYLDELPGLLERQREWREAVTRGR